VDYFGNLVLAARELSFHVENKAAGIFWELLPVL